MASASSSSSGGIGFLGMLTILFIALKLTGYIAWSWWWVLGPIWLPIALFIGFAAGVFAFACFVPDEKPEHWRDR